MASPLAEDARRILTARCGACHAQNAMGGLRLDSEAAFRQGGKSGRPTQQILLTALRGGGDGIKAMPPGKAIPAQEIETLARWLDQGATWPQEHWAFRPLQTATGSIDEWIEGDLARRKIQPAPAADQRTLIRRLSFDLTGPPLAVNIE